MLRMFEGFEVGTLAHLGTHLSHALDALSTTVVRTGAYAGQEANDSGAIGYTLPVAKTTVITGWAVAFSAPGADSSIRSIFILSDSAGLDIFALQVRWAAPNEIYVVNAAGGDVGSFTIPSSWVANTFTHYMEVKLTAGAAGSCEIRMNGVSVFSAVGQDFTDGNDNIGTVRLVNPRSTISYWDDWYVADTDAGVVTDFLGPVKVHPLEPNGNGSSSQWVGSDANSIDNYLLVDEVPSDSDTTYVESATLGQIDLYAFEDLPVGVDVVYGVMVGVIAKKTLATAETIDPLVRTGAANFQGAAFVLPETTYDGFFHLWDVNPQTLAQWTVAEVNTAEFGVEVT